MTYFIKIIICIPRCSMTLYLKLGVCCEYLTWVFKIVINGWQFLIWVTMLLLDTMWYWYRCLRTLKSLYSPQWYLHLYMWVDISLLQLILLTMVIGSMWSWNLIVHCLLSLTIEDRTILKVWENEKQHILDI